MFAWTVLTLVFLDELLAVAAAARWGLSTSGWLLAVAAGGAVVAVWSLFASPKAPFGHPVGRPVTKVAVFGLTGLGLAVAGYPAPAVVFVVFSVVVNGLALLPAVQAAVDGSSARG